MGTFLTGISSLLNKFGMLGVEYDWGEFGFMETIVDAINALTVPIMIVVGTAGIIYAIVLGVNLARAESTEKRDEAKKRMINAIVGLVSIFVLILLMRLLIEYMPQILGLDLAGPGGEEPPTP